MASNSPNLQVAMHLLPVCAVSFPTFPSSHEEAPVFPGQAEVISLSRAVFSFILLNKKPLCFPFIL
jgi:hypothetical protein